MPLPVSLLARLVLAACGCLPSVADAAPHGVDPTIFRDGFEPPAGLPVVEFERLVESGPLGFASDVVLAWATENADSCAGLHTSYVNDEWNGSKPLESDGTIVSPGRLGVNTLQLTCSNAVGSTTRSIDIEILPYATPQGPIVVLEVNSQSFAPGASATGRWYSQQASTCMASEAGPTPLGFTGVKPVSGNFWLGAQRPGFYGVTVTCSGALGSSSMTTHFRLEAQPGCDDPLVMPAGRVVENWGFTGLFSAPDGSPLANYPDSMGYPVPVGARRGGITAMPFSPTAMPAPWSIALLWDVVQALPAEGYATRQPASGMLFAISRCRGDVRPPVAGMPADPLLGGNCRAFGASGAIYYSAFNVGANLCSLPAGPEYWLNIMPADPGDGLAPGETTCEDEAHARCHVGATHRAM
jgi:hypothetical protein